MTNKKNLKKTRKKIPWYFRDPNFVPRNKMIRIIMFIVFNLIFIALLPILAININYPYGYLCWILVILFATLFNMKAFHIHAERYPLNNYDEYKFNPLKDALIEKGEIFVIEIKKIASIFEVKLKDKTLVFNMKGCLFPITIIKAYLGRQFIMECINKYKLISDTMEKNISIFKRFRNYINIQIIYNNGHKIKKWNLIKNSKTKMNYFMKSINGYGYITWYSAPHKTCRYFVKVEEETFVEKKLYYKT